MSKFSGFSRRFPPKPPSLSIGREINGGAYGTSHVGEFNGQPVTVQKIRRSLLEVPLNERLTGDIVGKDFEQFGRHVSGKKINRVVLGISRDERRATLVENFKKECSSLEEAENDHLVQFFGAYYDEESHEPLLVTERVHENLSEYLSKNQGELSISRQLQMCLEIVKGVHSLHSLAPPVIHRHLNDKNVMLTKEGLVKIGDLGQSRLKDVNKDYFSTGQPGAVLFMPPEALQLKPQYTEKTDTFSIGVLMLEVATQQSPQRRPVGIGISELKRREGDLLKLPLCHPLQPLILSCLQTDPKERPDTAILLRHLQSLVKDPECYKVPQMGSQEGSVGFVMEYRAPEVPANRVENDTQESPPKAATQLHKMCWFHGKISRSEAESKLNPKQNGLYLVRESTNYPGDYSLCVCINKVEHYHIKHRDDMYTIDEEEEFDSLTELIEYYQKGANGLVTRLCEPIVKEENHSMTIMDLDDFEASGWTIPKEKLTFGDKVRDTEFAGVFSGEYMGERVEIMSPNFDQEVLVNEDFLAEASIMASLSHSNLVKLIGVSVDQTSMYIITEFMENGSLLEYLRSRDRSVIQKSHQIGFARDVCSGMAYLEQKDLVHRDVAARNILVSRESIAKVSNFHLTCESGSGHQGVEISVQWMALEAIESGEFSNKSDVWSFGILLWEVYSFGRTPYPNVPVNDIITHVKEGGRLGCPENCPPEVYEIMKTCWYERPEDRPTLKELLEEFEALPPSACQP